MGAKRQGLHHLRQMSAMQDSRRESDATESFSSGLDLSKQRKESGEEDLEGMINLKLNFFDCSSGTSRLKTTAVSPQTNCKFKRKRVHKALLYNKFTLARLNLNPSL